MQHTGGDDRKNYTEQWFGPPLIGERGAWGSRHERPSADSVIQLEACPHFALQSHFCDRRASEVGRVVEAGGSLRPETSRA